MKNPGKFVKASNSSMQYKFKDGSFAKNEWVLHNDNYYYFNSKGIMQKNKWVNNYYYVDNDGKMKKSCFLEDDGKTYYLKEDGKYASNELVDINGKEYVFNKIGANIKNDTYKIATPSYTCYVNNDGYIEKGKGLTGVEGGTIYIEDEETGALKTNDWLKNESTGKYIFFDSDGWMVKNKKILELNTNGKITYLVDNTVNAFDGRSSKFILELYSNAKYYYVDVNGEMVTNANKIINGVEWAFDSGGVGKELNWKVSNYKNSNKKYAVNKYYYVGEHTSSLYDKGEIAYLELCIDNEDVALFLYDGENKKKVKNDYTYYDIDYNLTITSKSFQKGYKITGTMYGKGDRVFVDNNSARTTIKNLLLTGENFLITVREDENYWDETYEFIIDAGNYVDIQNKF